MTDIPSPSLTSNLAGQRSGDQLVDVEPQGLHPALFSGYRDLAKLRYDYPLLLTDGTNQSFCLRSLSDIGNEVQQVRRAQQQLASEIRELLAAQRGGRWRPGCAGRKG